MAGEHTAAADAGRVDHCALGIKVGRPDHHAYGGRKDNEALLHESELARTDPDPQFLHRPMRYDIGLPSPVI